MPGPVCSITWPTDTLPKPLSDPRPYFVTTAVGETPPEGYKEADFCSEDIDEPFSTNDEMRWALAQTLNGRECFAGGAATSVEVGVGMGPLVCECTCDVVVVVAMLVLVVHNFLLYI